MWYKLDIEKFTVLLLPTFLRRERTMAWLRALIFPISQLYSNWAAFRERNLYILTHSGQVVYLRKVLNDSFDPALRRIQIVDGNRFGRVYIYTSGEMKPAFLGAMYLRNSIDFADTGVDFIVLVPAGLQFNNFDMTALIDFYRLASKRYTIQTI
ncbi:MAG: hypothetical protein KKC03_06580 [Bacteroidetes bacterium]|nr:hypothetical protein [Bacteroidota bacterium]